jgi:hypothetical protein
MSSDRNDIYAVPDGTYIFGVRGFYKYAARTGLRINLTTDQNKKSFVSLVS